MKKPIAPGALKSQKPKPVSLWWFFAYFVLLNFLISYGRFSNPAKVALIVVGMVLPFLTAAKFSPSGAEPPGLFQKEFLPPVKSWFWVFPVLAGVILHFYQLDRPWLGWLKSDEGLDGIFSIGLSREWNWKYYYFSGQFPGFFIWISGLLFRYFSNPFFNLLAAPAFFSALFLPLSYLALRTQFSKSLSFTGSCLAAFNLWNFTLSRTALPGSLVLPWEAACFLCLGAFLGEKEPARKKGWAALLGFSTGLCYLNCPIWPFVVLLVLLTGLAAAILKPTKYVVGIPFFLLGFLPVLMPFFILVARGDYNLSNRVLSSFGNSIPLYQRLEVTFSYFSSWFWGPLKGVGVFSPENFERFNPLLGSVVWVGCLQLVRRRSQWISRWMLLAALVFFLPSLVSVYVEMYRVLTLLPVFLLAGALGLGSLLGEIRKEKRYLVLSLLLALSTVWDGAVVEKFSKDQTNFLLNQPMATTDLENPRAYHLLESAAGPRGPGLIFTEFLNEGNDHTLFVSTYDINAAENPRLDPAKAGWAAVMTDLHYYPFLARRFPQAHWFNLRREPSHPYDTILGIMDVNEQNRPTFEKWIPAQDYFLRMHRDVGNISAGKDASKAWETLDEGKGWAKGDPFLEGSYWEMMADVYYQYGFQYHYGDVVESLRMAIQNGYPAEDLYFKLGSLYLRKKNFTEARQAFQKALQLEPDNGDARAALDLLSKMEKNPGYSPP